MSDKERMVRRVERQHQAVLRVIADGGRLSADVRAKLCDIAEELGGIASDLAMVDEPNPAVRSRFWEAVEALSKILIGR